MLTYHVTGSPTITTVNLGMNLHGLTRSKELVDTFHKVGACIGYGLVRLLRDAWAVHDLQLCTDCPIEIMEDKPGVIIVDNDDFHNDTLTGANTSHRTNVMYVKRDSLEDQGPQCGDRVKDAKTLSSALKEIAAGIMTATLPTSGESHQSKIECNLPLEVSSLAVLFTHWFEQILLVSGLWPMTRRFPVSLASRL